MKVSLKKLKRKDFSFFYRWWNDPELRKLTSGKTKKISNKEVNKILERHLIDENGFDFIINVDKKPIGHILIQRKKRKKYFEIYIAIGEKKYWGKGIGTAVIKKSCYWFFKKFFRENCLELEVLPDNIRAIKSYEKSGFKKIKIKHYKNFPETILMKKFR